MICPYFGKCGGCSSLDVPYEKQVVEKNEAFKKNLSQIADDVVFEEPVTGPALGYRSRARFRYSKQGLSFYQEKTNSSVLIKSCPVLDVPLNAFLANPPKINLWELEDGQLPCITANKGVIYNSDQGWITVDCRDVVKRLPVSNDVFFQSNLILLPKLIDWVVDHVSGPNVMDLYSGVGTFSAFLEEKFNVTAVEINKKCLSLAKMHLNKTKFFASPVEKWNPKKQKVDTVIVDPPRVGLDYKVPAMIASWEPSKLIYVSCYMPTQMRDIKRLVELGYKPELARLFDFYPNTPHIETVVILDRVKVNSHIDVDLDVGELGMGQEPVINADIQTYINKKYGFNVSPLYIAQIKEKLGIKEHQNYNVGSGKRAVPICPKEKEEAIMVAFRHFGLI